MRRLLRVGGVAVLGLAGPGLAAELVDVRVGVHPGFTRVVFELDAVAGYSIGATSHEGSGDELVIELEASSRRRLLASDSATVEWVRVEPEAGGSVARIGLRGSGTLRLAEDVLADPPRIVLDLHPAEVEKALAGPVSP